MVKVPNLKLVCERTAPFGQNSTAAGKGVGRNLASAAAADARLKIAERELIVPRPTSGRLWRTGGFAFEPRHE